MVELSPNLRTFVSVAAALLVTSFTECGNSAAVGAREGLSGNMKFLGVDESPLTDLEELTKPLPRDHYAILRCGGLDERANRGAGSAYWWCNMAFEAGHMKPELPPMIGFSFGIQAWDTWSKCVQNPPQCPTAHLHGVFLPSLRMFRKCFADSACAFQRHPPDCIARTPAGSLSACLLTMPAFVH